MEQEKDDNIGQLFRSSFEGHKQAPEREEWEMLQTSLQRFNFFKFNAFQFNVYYASTIVFCFLTCLGVGSHYTFTHVLRPNHSLTNTNPLIESDRSETESSNKKDVATTNSSTLNQSQNPGYGKGNNLNDVPKTFNNSKSANAVDQQDNSLNSNNLTSKDLHSKSSSAILPNSAFKIDSSHKNTLHIQNVAAIDSAKIKKRTVYITKQDTIYKYDTLRAPKPKRRKF